MNIQEIKQAVSEGKTVNWVNALYEIKKSGDDFVILCISNQNCIGLTWMDGVTLNGKEEDFFVKLEATETKDENRAEEVGAYLAKVLGLKKKTDGRYHLGEGWSTKTDLGLYLTVKRIIEEKRTK